MLYATQNQFLVFAIIFSIMFLSSFLFDISNLIFMLTEKNSVVKNVFHFFATSVILFVFYEVVLKFNYGVFRWFVFLALVLATILQRVSFGKLIAKFYDLWYNWFEKLKTKINKREKHDGQNQENENQA